MQLGFASLEVPSFSRLIESQAIFQSAYPSAEEQPAPCPIDESVLLQLVSSLPARGTHASVNPCLGNGRLAASSASSNAGAMQMCQTFCNVMGMVMQQNQGRSRNPAAPLIHMMGGGGGRHEPPADSAGLVSLGGCVWSFREVRPSSTVGSPSLQSVPCLTEANHVQLRPCTTSGFGERDSEGL